MDADRRDDVGDQDIAPTGAEHSRDRAAAADQPGDGTKVSARARSGADLRTAGAARVEAGPVQVLFEDEARGGRAPPVARDGLSPRAAGGGYAGGISILKDWLSEQYPSLPTPQIIRFETPPGRQAQVDWTAIRRGRNKLSAFVGTLGFSRLSFVWFADNEMGWLPPSPAATPVCQDDVGHQPSCGEDEECWKR